MNIPVIETARLRMRAHNRGDLEACAAMYVDPLVIQHIGGKPSSTQQTWFKILRYLGMWEAVGFGYWAVEDRETGEFVGDVGLANFMRDIAELDGVPEAGWVLARSAHSRGFATEAVRAALTWADEHLAAPKTACIIAPENPQSIRVAEKCGYRETARTLLFDDPTIVYFRERGG